MIKVRLARTGPRKKPFYRIVATDERKKAQGQPLEVLGYWNPTKNEKKIDKDKVKKWLSKGAKQTSAVTKIL